MLKVRAEKIAREKQRAAQRKKAATVAPGFETRHGCHRSEIREAPMYRVLVSRAIDESGIGDVVVARELKPNLLAVAVVLLDPYCLGVKDAFLRLCSNADFDRSLNQMREVEDFEVVPPSHARKRIDGAIAYARDLGFEPHPDYRDASVVLDGVDPTECDVEFTYGKDGKPFYVSGPNHTPEQSRRIMNHLAARLGRDGFHCLVGIGNVIGEA
jgi:hypothetical protein